MGSDLGVHHSLAIWDARNADPELDERDEADSRVAFWFDRPLATEAVREHLRHDVALAEPTRRRALELVDAYGQARARREAEDRIDRLANEGLFQSEILERLQTDPDLSGPVREEALVLAASPVENAFWLDIAGRSVATHPGAMASAYQRALEQAETASRVMPYRSGFRVTLGMARYRLGQYNEAVETLSRAQPSGSPRDEAAEAPRLAFLAMAEYRLGRLDRAKTALENFRDVLRRAARAGDEEIVSIRQEAEQLIEPGPGTQSSTSPAPNDRARTGHAILDVPGSKVNAAVTSGPPEIDDGSGQAPIAERRIDFFAAREIRNPAGRAPARPRRRPDRRPSGPGPSSTAREEPSQPPSSKAATSVDAKASPARFVSRGGRSRGKAGISSRCGSPARLVNSRSIPRGPSVIARIGTRAATMSRSSRASHSVRLQQRRSMQSAE